MTDSPPAFGTFFLPGPTEVRRPVLEAMLQPMLPHRGAAFEAMFARIHAGLQTVLRTERPVFVSSSSATGLMEAAVRCAPEGPVLSLVNGAFSERFADVAHACGREVHRVEVPWGGTATPDDAAAALRQRRYAVVTLVHSETSTGALTDPRPFQTLAREHGALLLLDSVTGAGGAELETDAWELDFVLTGSQKALAMPPGLAFAVASAEYMRTAANARARGVYFDLVEFARYGVKHQTPNTPALSLLYAAERQLADVAAEGMEARWARHRAMAERTWAWADTLAARLGDGIGVLATAGGRSPTVTAVTLPARVACPSLTSAVARRGYVIGSGYGRLRDTTFRIGHMGDHTLDGLAGCLAAVEDAVGEVLGA